MHANTILWTDKYKPRNLTGVIGNADIIEKIIHWLSQWTKNNKDKAVLLTGPPGIGKSTIAILACTSLGYQPLELNASDARNKSIIHDRLSDTIGTHSIFHSAKGCVVIMDEVDGMSSADRGGISELVQLIKKTKIPIICIGNDRQCTGVRSLVTSCYDLRVKRSPKHEIVAHLQYIIQSENIPNLPIKLLEDMTEQSGNDIRNVIHTLQLWAGSSPFLTSSKDIQLRKTAFDSCNMILSGEEGVEKRHSFDERYESFFVDYSLMPLFIHHNYISSLQNRIKSSRNAMSEKSRECEWLSEAADAVSNMDLFTTWDMLPAQAAMAVNAGSIVHGYQSFPAFPQWLGKNSTTNKSYRQLREISIHTSAALGSTLNALRLDYIPYMPQYFLGPLLDIIPANVKPSVSETIQRLCMYGLSRDDLMESLRDICLDSTNSIFTQIDTKTKSALTRMYNNSTSGNKPAVQLKTVDAEEEDTERSSDAIAAMFMKKTPIKTKKTRVVKKKS